MDYDLNYKSIFLGNTYGPHGKFHSNGTVIHNLIYRFFQSIQDNTDVHLYGNGKVFRNYLYVEDLNCILDKIILNKEVKDPIIVSQGSPISILEIVEIIKQITGFKNKIIFDSDKSIGNQIKLVDNTKLKEIIGDFNFTELKLGIEKTISWYEKNKNISL
jgi:GDP-L-fucose synthase